MNKKLIKWMPMSETAYYILLSLSEPRHGYGIIKYVEKLTSSRITLGSGTIYTTLGKMKKDGIIHVLHDVQRKTVYKRSEFGDMLLKEEKKRLNFVLEDTLKEERKHDGKKEV